MFRGNRENFSGVTRGSHTRAKDNRFDRVGYARNSRIRSCQPGSRAQKFGWKYDFIRVLQNYRPVILPQLLINAFTGEVKSARKSRCPVTRRNIKGRPFWGRF
jgi:hypothetical protein